MGQQSFREAKEGGRGGSREKSAYKFARDAKEVEAPQVAGMLPDRLLLCRAIVDKLAKQLVVPQVEGRVPFSPLPCSDRPCKDCSTPTRGRQILIACTV